MMVKHGWLHAAQPILAKTLCSEFSTTREQKAISSQEDDDVQKGAALLRIEGGVEFIQRIPCVIFRNMSAANLHNSKQPSRDVVLSHARYPSSGNDIDQSDRFRIVFSNRQYGGLK